MQYNSQRFNKKPNTQQNNSEIEQYFGNGNLFEQQQVSGGHKAVIKPLNRPQKDPFSILSKVELIPIEKGKGFLSFFILLGVLLIPLVIQMAWDDILNTILLGIFTFFAWKRVSFQMTEDFPHYLSNATVTWKALLTQIPLTRSLISYSRHITLWSILLLSVQSLLLDFILPSTLTSFIHSVSFFGVFIGIALCFGNRQYDFLYQALTLFAFILMLQMIIYVIAYAYMHVFAGFTILFIWTISSYLKEWAMIDKKMDKVKNNEKFDIGHST